MRLCAWVAAAAAEAARDKRVELGPGGRVEGVSQGAGEWGEGEGASPPPCIMTFVYG